LLEEWARNPGWILLREDAHAKLFGPSGAAAFLTIAGVGWYLGWYDVIIQPRSDGHHKVDIDVNIPKVREALSGLRCYFFSLYQNILRRLFRLR
jgi:hypothetical protein